MKKLFAFSGLGADKRVFSQLDLSEYDVIYVDWVTPSKFESLADYVIRLAQYYNIPKQGALGIGVSFGGICLSELAKSLNFEKIILISSAKTKFELPSLYSWTMLVPFIKLIPRKILITPNFILNWFFGVKGRVEKDLLANIIKETDADFLKWAIIQIVVWKNTQIPINHLHIHGVEDRIIPIKNINQATKIASGGHFMIFNQASEISNLINKFF